MSVTQCQSPRPLKASLLCSPQLPRNLAPLLRSARGQAAQATPGTPTPRRAVPETVVNLERTKTHVGLSEPERRLAFLLLLPPPRRGDQGVVVPASASAGALRQALQRPLCRSLVAQLSAPPELPAVQRQAIQVEARLPVSRLGWAAAASSSLLPVSPFRSGRRPLEGRACPYAES